MAPEYFERLAAEHRIGPDGERDLLWEYLRSIGAERGFCEFARLRAGEGGCRSRCRADAIPTGTTGTGATLAIRSTRTARGGPTASPPTSSRGGESAQANPRGSG